VSTKEEVKAAACELKAFLSRLSDQKSAGPVEKCGFTDLSREMEEVRTRAAKVNKDVKSKQLGKLLGQLADCWENLTCMRAVEVKIFPADMSWPEAWDLIGRSMDQARNIKNQLVRQLMRHDTQPPVLQKNGKYKLPLMKLPTVKKDGHSFYLQARAAAPLLNSGTVSQILRDVEASYKRNRWSAWIGDRQMPNYRDSNLPVRKQELENHPLTEVEIVDKSGKKTSDGFDFSFPFTSPATGKVFWTRWKVSPGERHGNKAISLLRQVAAGHADLRMIYLINRRRGGKNKLMGKFVVRVPRAPRAHNATETLLVSTTPQALLTYTTTEAGSERKSMKYRHVRRLLAQKRKLEFLDNGKYGHINDLIARRQALIGDMAGDMVRERRTPKRKRRHMVEGNRVRLDKLGRALDDAIKCAAQEVASVARRWQCGKVVYRDVIAKEEEEIKTVRNKKVTELVTKYVSDNSWAPDFAWAALRNRIKTLCEEQSIEFVHDEQATLFPPSISPEEKKEFESLMPAVGRREAGAKARC